MNIIYICLLDLYFLTFCEGHHFVVALNSAIDKYKKKDVYLKVEIKIN